MAESKLIISGTAQTKEVLLDPKGVTLGRGLNCDVILNNSKVSRHHARIYKDLYGRWIVEDIESHNGVFVDGQRIEAQTVLPSQKIIIQPFTLYISEEADERTGTGTSFRTQVQIVDKGLAEDIVSYEASQVPALSPDLMRYFNEFTDSLLELSSPSELYLEACSCLAGMLDALVAIVRLPCGSVALPKSPEILACYFGGNETGSGLLQTPFLHFSKRVLDAVRTQDVPVKAGSRPSSGRNIELTVIDTHKPHVVFAARVNDTGESIDALYIDILESKAPKGMFELVEAVARQVNFTQKNLFFTVLEKREKALREANIELKEKDRIKDQYVSRVTHDIKGHLTAIRSCLQVATDKSTGPLNEKQTDFMGQVRRRNAQLSDFVNNLLNLTQMRLSGQFQAVPFSLSNTIGQALAAVEREAEDKSITVTSNVEPSADQMVGSQFSINEMLTNLLFNAVKYTPANKSVRLEAKSRGDCIEIKVSDTGIGIPADEIEHVFDEFFRGSNARAAEKDGTGLGLSIVKQIVEKHEGRISVTSRQGQGTTFTVTLPKSISTLS